MNHVQAKILFASNSGNTEHLAELLHNELTTNGYEVEVENVKHAVIKPLSQFDLVLVGSFTRGEGDLPRQWKKYFENGMYNHPNVAVFGTGDTQWGNSYCGACDTLAAWYESSYEPLRIEHYPDSTQENKVKQWIGEIINETNNGYVTSRI